jgi:hypothetical protein
LAKSVKINRFGRFAQNRQNGFVALGNCFKAVSSAARTTGLWPPNLGGIGEMGSKLDVLAGDGATRRWHSPPTN